MCNPIIKNCKSINTIAVYKVFVRKENHNKRVLPEQHRTPYYGRYTPHSITHQKASDHGYSAFLDLETAKRYGRSFAGKWSIWYFRVSNRSVFKIGYVDVSDGRLLCVMVPKLSCPQFCYKSK